MSEVPECQEQSVEIRISELFFSTTDSRGVMTSCNDVFRRLSGYSQVELMGSPHNIIRHEHMPRAVFHLLWERLRKGAAFFGYIKNLAKDGRYYWVASYVTPIFGGYLSIRFKPTSSIFENISSVYGSMLQIETADVGGAGGMQQAGSHLETECQRLGYSNYAIFMGHALQEEIHSRDTLLAQRGQTIVPQTGVSDASIYSARGALLRDIHLTGLQTYKHLNVLFKLMGEFSAIAIAFNGEARPLAQATRDTRLWARDLNQELHSGRDAPRDEMGLLTNMETVAERISLSLIGMKRGMILAATDLQEVTFELMGARLKLEMLLQFCHSLLSGNLRRIDGTTSADREWIRLIGMLEHAFTSANAQMLDTWDRIKMRSSELGAAAQQLNRMQADIESLLQRALATPKLSDEAVEGGSLQDLHHAIDRGTGHLMHLSKTIRRLSELSESAPDIVAAVSLGCARIERDISKLAASG